MNVVFIIVVSKLNNKKTKTKTISYIHRLGFRACNTQKTRMTNCARFFSFRSCTMNKNHNDEHDAHHHDFRACTIKKN
jgi:hypothetical protein